MLFIRILNEGYEEDEDVNASKYPIEDEEEIKERFPLVHGLYDTLKYGTYASTALGIGAGIKKLNNSIHDGTVKAHAKNLYHRMEKVNIPNPTTWGNHISIQNKRIGQAIKNNFKPTAKNLWSKTRKIISPANPITLGGLALGTAIGAYNIASYKDDNATAKLRYEEEQSQKQYDKNKRKYLNVIYAGRNYNGKPLTLEQRKDLIDSANNSGFISDAERDEIYSNLSNNTDPQVSDFFKNYVGYNPVINSFLKYSAATLGTALLAAGAYKLYNMWKEYKASHEDE